MPEEKSVEAYEDGKNRDQIATEATHEITPAVNFIAGGVVSSVSKMIVYPMETKVLLIAVEGSASSNPMRLWHGVIVQGVENFLYSGLLWSLKEYFRPPPPDPAFPEKRPNVTFVKAFGASCIAILLSHPIANTVVTMQASLRSPTEMPLSALQAAKNIMKLSGLGGFFTGWQFSILLRLGCAVTFIVYDFVRSWIAGVVGDDASNFIAGLLGRLSEVYCNQPLKTLRSRQQLGQSMLLSWKPSEIIRLWDGVGTMAIADAVKIGIRFLLIERLRTILQWLLNRRQKQFSLPVTQASFEKDSKSEEKAMGG